MSILGETEGRQSLGRFLSREMYERLLKENGPNQEVFMSYASFLAEGGLIKDTLEMVCHTYKQYSTSTEKLFPIVSKLVDFVRQETKENGNPPYRNVYSCPCCRGVLSEPITLSCGHTYCTNCLLKETLRTCRVCHCKLKNFSFSNVKPNVLVSTLVGRWWSGERKGVRLRSQGNNYFKENQLEKAVQLYTEAAENAPQDHLLLSNRSHVLHVLGRAEEALMDAEAAVRCRPDWAKGYFRRAMALVSLGRSEDAFVSLLQCAVLEEYSSLKGIREELTKALHRLMVRLSCGRRFSLEGRNGRHFPNNLSRLNSSRTDLCIPPMSDSDDSEDSEDCQQRHVSETSAVSIEEVPQLRRIAERFNQEMEKIKKSSGGYIRQADPNYVDKSDFECTLCFRYLYQPVTTPCGHSFCRTCLDRCLDHSTNCPLCKTSIRVLLTERRSAVTEFIEAAMQSVMPSECMERQLQHDEELAELAAAGKDPHHEIPIFIATIAIPTITCPLHVFEPRYRLMIRRCMESGTREFGMCMPMENAENGYADHGTMLEIRDIEFTPDGRSIVNTIGSRRFRIVSKNARDGYNTASVEFLQDDIIPTHNLGETRRLHDSIHQLASRWFDSIENFTKKRILGHYGPMPPVEAEYWTVPNGPAWMWWIVAILPLDPRIQLSILRESSLQRRLEVLHLILRRVMVQQRARQAAAVAGVLP